MKAILLVCSLAVLSPIAQSQSTSGANDSELKGAYAFTFNGITGSGGNTSVFAAVGRFTADGAGNVTNGELDTNGVGPGAALSALAFTGTYSIGADHRGVMSLNIPGGAKLALAMTANGNAQFIEFDASGGSGTIGSGTMEKVDSSAYSTAKIVGNYAFGASGLDNLNNRAALAGRFTSNGAGSLTSVAGDVNAYGAVYPMIFSSANYVVSNPSAGRGTMSLAFQFGGRSDTLNFVFYIVNSGKFFVMENDSVSSATPLLNGAVIQQQSLPAGFSNTSLNGGAVIYLTGSTVRSTCGAGSGDAPNVLAGLLSAAGNGTLTLSFDESCGGIPNFVGGQSGTYSIESNGRVSISVGGATAIAYLVGLNEAFLLDADSSARFGFVEAQAVEALNNTAVQGGYAGFATTPATFGVQVFSGEFTANGARPTGTIQGTLDIGSPNGPFPSVAFDATYSISSSPTNGRGTMTITSNSGERVVTYLISPTKFVAIPLDDPNPSVWVFEQSSTTTGPVLSLASLSLNPTSMTGGAQSSAGTVALTGPAPAGGIQITLSSNNTAAARVPLSVTVPAGATSATFAVTTSAVNASTSANISASYGGVTKIAVLNVNPQSSSPVVTRQPASQTVIAGQSATFSVSASGTAPLSYQWKKNGASIAGATSSSYTTPPTTTADSGSQFSVLVSNSAGSVTSNPATLTVNPQPLPTLSSLVLNPTSVLGGLQSSIGRVTLSAPAPAGGAKIILSSSSGAASVPSAVIVPAGATSVNFIVNSNIVLLSTTATISASYNGGTKTAILSVLL